jgi:hypothetical protein
MLRSIEAAHGVVLQAMWHIALGDSNSNVQLASTAWIMQQQQRTAGKRCLDHATPTAAGVCSGESRATAKLCSRFMSNGLELF